MRKRKSSDEQARAKGKRGTAITSSYPAGQLTVNTDSIPCLYFRAPTPKRRKGFCSFSGEDLRCPCEFFRPGGGA